MGIDVDLSLEACHAFWAGFDDNNIISIIRLMEQSEHWTLDHNPMVAESLLELGHALKDVKDGNGIDAFDKILSLCVYLRMSQKLRFMQTLDQLDPGTAAKLIQYAEKKQFQSADASLFLKRNVVFERMRIISRMLAPGRIDMLRHMIDKNF